MDHYGTVSMFKYMNSNRAKQQHITKFWYITQNRRKTNVEINNNEWNLSHYVRLPVYGMYWFTIREWKEKWN